LPVFWYFQRKNVLEQGSGDTMKLRSFFVYLAASAGFLLVIGAVVWFWLASHSPLALMRGVQPTPAAAMLVPRQAPLMVSLLVNPDRLETFRQAITPAGKRRRSRAEWNQFRQRLLARTGLDYRRDIQPWLGDEITFAVTTPDLDRQQDNGLQPGYLLSLAVRQPQGGRQFLERFWQQRALSGQDLVFEQYQGVKLIYGATPPQAPSLESRVATALVGDRFVLVANHPKVLRGAINNLQAPDLEMGSAKDYQQALTSLEQGGIGFAFFNLAEIARKPGSPAVSESPQPASLAVSLGLHRQGLLAETVLMTSPQGATASIPQLDAPAAALRYLPASSGFSISGTALNQVWTQLSAGLGTDDWLSPFLNQPLQDLEARWQLDLPQDIFSWVDGEYALAMVPTAATPGAPPDWVFVAQQAQSAPAAEGLQHLDDLAQAQGLGIGPLVVAGQKVTAWTRLAPTTATTTVGPELLSAQVVGGAATVDGYTILASSLAAMEQVFKASQASLLMSESFQKAIAPLPQPNSGYFYLNWPASRSVLEHQFPLLRAIEAAGQPFFNHLQALSLTRYDAESPGQHSKLFIQLS
jgi:hypothetical protein